MEQSNRKLFKISLAISRVLSGEASDAEREAVDGWLNASEENKRLFERLQEEGLLARKVRIYQTIDKQAAFNEFLKEKAMLEERRRRLRFGRVLKYAAILILPLLVGGVYLLNQLLFEEKKVLDVATVISHGERKAVLHLSDGSTVDLDKSNVMLNERNGMLISSKDSGLIYHNGIDDHTKGLIYNTLDVPTKGEFYMQLSDGTKVWIGARSRLKYPVAFNGKTREVYLEGEAFFEVAKNPDKPFIVKTKDFSVRALGTSFNVMNYADDDFSHATLKTGKVEVTADKQKMLLEPGEQAFYKDHHASVKKVDVDVYTAWMGNVFKFDKENIDVILRKIARWYDVHIFYMNESVKNYHFKGTLPKYTNLSDVLGLLEQTTDIKFQIKGNTVVVMKDGARESK